MILRSLHANFRSLCTLSLQQQLHTTGTRIFPCNRRIGELVKLGKIDEARRLFDAMPQRDVVSWNLLITAYTRTGYLEEARKLFDSFQDKNVRTWTIMLSGYARSGLVNAAKAMFDVMPERNVVSYNAMITGYVRNGDVHNARRMFDEMPERNIVTWNSMITGYCQYGSMREARELFDQMGERNVFTWASIINGYVAVSGFYDAWGLFFAMHKSGVQPDQSTFVVVLSAVTGLNDLGLVGCLRSLSVKTGYEKDLVVGTAILNAYTRNGCLDSASKFFELMPERNDYSWSTMIAALSQCGRVDEAIALYERVPEKNISLKTAALPAYAQKGRICEARAIFNEIKNPNVVSWNAMLSGYVENGMLEEAKNIFMHMPMRNCASWAAMLSGLVQLGESNEALEFIAELHRSGTILSHSSFTSALTACTNTIDFELGRQIHSFSIKRGCQYNVYVSNALIAMYAKCKNIEHASQVFNAMRARDVVSWNSLISAFSQSSMLDDARSTFDKMPNRDVVSWNTIISVFLQAGQGNVALEYFIDMLNRGIKPDEFTIITVLSVCGTMGSIRHGEQIHALINKLGFVSFLIVSNALIAMYFNCGSCVGFSIFEKMHHRDIITWNAVLDGCVQNELGQEAVRIFKQMEAEGIFPDEISFLAILRACSQMGLVDKGWAYFDSMSQKYGIAKSVHHYTCMVDLLGRAGQLSEAESFIKDMPMQPDFVTWKTLLLACRTHRNIELGQRVAERLIQLGTPSTATYITLSDIYASQGMWEKAEEIKKLIKQGEITKESE